MVNCERVPLANPDLPPTCSAGFLSLWRGTSNSIRAPTTSLDYSSGLRPVICTLCQQQFHKQCSGISRYVQRQRECFVCMACRCVDTIQQTAAVKALHLFLPCAICHVIIRQDYRPYRCWTCTAIVHRSCLGLHRHVSLAINRFI